MPQLALARGNVHDPHHIWKLGSCLTFTVDHIIYLADRHAGKQGQRQQILLFCCTFMSRSASATSCCSTVGESRILARDSEIRTMLSSCLGVAVMTCTIRSSEVPVIVQPLCVSHPEAPQQACSTELMRQMFGLGVCNMLPCIIVEGPETSEDYEMCPSQACNLPLRALARWGEKVTEVIG